MKEQIRNIVDFLFGIDKRERLKVFFLSFSFFCVIGSYTILKEIKDSIFASIVGRDYIPWAKLVTILLLIPAILGYSRLVDQLRRYQLLYFFSILYGVCFLIFAYLVGHPVIGLPNTDTGPTRLLGWSFYFIIESFSPFLVSVFWAFVNSITDPQAAKRNYTIIIANSKLGGICTSLIALWILRPSLSLDAYSADVYNHQTLLLLCSLILLIVPLFVFLLIKKVPKRDLHGYEAAYRVEKKRDHASEGGLFNAFKGAIEGLIVILKYPYMLGIFGMIFFYEVVNVVFSYARLGVGQAASDSISDFSSFLISQAMYVHCIGLVIVLFGSRTLVNLLGEKWCLLLVPLSTGILLLYYFTTQSATAMGIVFVIIRSINYAFANPLREALYIPTVKDMKFKARSWIDAFGGRSAKASGSVYNILAAGLADGASIVNALFFAIIIGLWTLNALLVGRRYEYAVEHNEVIGAEPKSKT